MLLAAMNNNPRNKSEGFIYYKLPAGQDIHYLFGEIKRGYDKDDEGFIIQPFDTGEMPFIIKGVGKICSGQIRNEGETLFFSNDIPDNKVQSHYSEIVAEALKQIKMGALDKVVLSRTKKAHLPSGFSPYVFLKNICRAYPDAFVYLLSIPKYGTWIGASPELLINVEDKALKTMSLAGTVLNGGNFTGKEINEQEPVTGYIVEMVEKFGKNLMVKQPSVKKAGNVKHIVTEISADFEGDIPGLLKALHPTPAVAGLPKAVAIDFINKNEGYNRSLYSGYLGPVSKHKADIFVNLRCMQVFGNEAVLYAGAGIVDGSVPEKEKQETENKMDTLLTHLK